MEDMLTENDTEVMVMLSMRNGSTFANRTDEWIRPDNESYPTSQEIIFYFYLWQVVTPIVFACIIGIGTIGNALVVYVIASKPTMQSATNILVASLAVADISFLVICVPFNIYKYAADTWPFGDTVCKLVQYLQYVTVFVTVYTLAAVSALRVLVIVWTTGSARFRTNRNAVIIAVLIWLGAFLVNIPTYLVHADKEWAHDYNYCGIYDNAIVSFVVSFFVAGYAVPLLLISVLYAIIIMHLYAHRPVTMDQRRSRERNTRTLRVVVLVVIVFGLSWLPTHLQSIASIIAGRLPGGMTYEVFRILWLCIAYGNSCANPFIYHYGSKEFRRSFQEMLRCGKVWSDQNGTREQGDGSRRETVIGCGIKGRGCLRSRMESLTLGSRRSTFDRSAVPSSDDLKVTQMFNMNQLKDAVSMI